MSDPLQMIADQLAIRAVLHRYCRYLDLRRPDLVAQEVYTADAVDDRGRHHVPTGRAEIEAMFRAALESLEATAHVLGSISVDVDGDRATSEAYVTAWHWSQGPPGLPATRPADFALVAVYLDEFVRTPAGWRVRHRRLQVAGPGGVALGELPDRFRGFGGVSDP